MKPLTITKNDLVQAYRWSLFRNIKKNRRFIILFELICVAAFLVSLFLLDQPLDWLVIAAIGVLLLPCCVLCVYYVSIPIRAHKDYRRVKLYKSPQAIHWDDQYLYFSSKESNGQLSWAIYIDMLDAKEHVLLYSHDRIVSIFAKRFFESEEEMNDFLEHARCGVAENKSMQ